MPPSQPSLAFALQVAILLLPLTIVPFSYLHGGLFGMATACTCAVVWFMHFHHDMVCKILALLPHTVQTTPSRASE